MEIKINVYDKSQVIKTYTVNDFDLSMGTIEEVVEVFDLDNLATLLKSNKSTDKVGLIEAVGRMVQGSFSTTKNLLLEVFPEMTEEEFKKTKLKEVILVIKNLIMYSISVIGLANSSTEKN